MPVSCPHCSGDIQPTIDQTLKDRLKRKDEANQKKVEGLRRELELTERKLSDASGNSAELEDLRTKVAEYETKITTSERKAFLTAAGVPADKLDDVLDDLSLIFDNRAQADAEGNMPTFEAFYAADGPGRASPVVQAVLPASAPEGGAPPGAPGAVPAPTSSPTTPPVRAPSSSAGAVPTTPAQSTRMTPAQLEAYFRSPEFQRMPREQQVAKERELAGQHNARYDYNVPSPT